MKEFISASPKRQKLKDFFTKGKAETSPEEQVQSIGQIHPEKRQSLKDFFSNVPVKTENDQERVQEGSMA